MWFGPSDIRNCSALVPGLSHSNQAAELYAVSLATAAVPPFAPLHIVSDSRYVISGLTKHLPMWEDTGWYGLANAPLIRDVVARLRARSAPTTFRWVKGHSGIPGNEGADALAKTAVEMKQVHLLPPAPLKFVAMGARLSVLTQKLAYGFIRDGAPPPMRRTSQTNLESAAEALEDYAAQRPRLASIWVSIWQMDSDRRVRVFWWKMLHGAHRLGRYWLNVTGFTHRAYCPYCGEVETMTHLMCDCPNPWRLALWREAMALLHVRSIPVDAITFGHILGVPVLQAPPRDGHRNPANTRLLRCVLREMTYLIWVLRCEWVISRGGDMAHPVTVQEAVPRLYRRLNRCLHMDIARSRGARGTVALAPATVLATWQGLVESSTPLPEDWLSVRGVLVGRPGVHSQSGIG